MNQVYIFKVSPMVKPEDVKRIHDKLKRQIEEGVVLMEYSTDFIRREMRIKGCPIAVEILPTNYEVCPMCGKSLRG